MGLADEVEAHVLAGGPRRPYRALAGLLEGLRSCVYQATRPRRGTFVLLHGGPHGAAWPIVSPALRFISRLRVNQPSLLSQSRSSLKAAPRLL